MIFVTLGSQKFQFNRLLKEVDTLIAEGIIKEEVFAQIGYSDYKPINFEFKDFLDRNEFATKMQKSDIVITHGGTGAIIGAVKKGKKVIAVPRLAKYGEHVDDHQIQLIKQFDNLEIIEPCYECVNLDRAYLSCVDKKYCTYVSNTTNIINNIDRFLQEEKLQ
ncbi:beta(1,3)galactosyltransferase EpsH [Faecalitalea cylindroides]|uniref:PssE/Cps14G family polysaccharide biosynthesis glycosyltransferase n=1 Tax=Faecalitalea cylindroides TaxID=39483 RepID=UPI00195AADD6|nr:PssE/Cps14G family polysaccharide biosynthesis glycosyltransferase [Faecalitalea cylindroides]MBM6810030.1 beta(1,3)galactosyltransferase EpsH [Faecalitalea cylindroides]